VVCYEQSSDIPLIESLGTHRQAYNDGHILDEVGHGPPCVLLEAAGRDGILDVRERERWSI